MKRREFNWITALQGAMVHEPGPGKYADLLARAGRWPTCACGALCERLPRDEFGAPVDTTLYDYGIDFYRRVSDAEWKRALAIFLKIERRTAKLVALWSQVQRREYSRGVAGMIEGVESDL